MQLVLLSGGSGQRLWPLSNNARSKQFLSLLTSPSGGAESMIQRVVRQIKESNITNNISIATNKIQHDSIINQLGVDVNIITEPDRRDTFPAIALASSFLKIENNCPDDEVVVVMPCDVYTEKGYFDTIAQMAKAINDNKANLVLMGVKPTYPSEKFGYIIPNNSINTNVFQVERFTEKPNTGVAKILLAQGALWNGGVFAFRLGYMMDIVNKYIQANTYNEIVSNYDKFPKISFDYEVVEKATSVAVVPFEGIWHDLGTWNALCEQLSSAQIGNVYMGKHNNNTHVINELNIPIFCDGLNDIVIAASPDGIMVCNKEQSEHIKDHVQSIATRPMYEERRWGTYKVIDQATYSDGAQSLSKTITLKPGRNISYQLHHHRAEVWTVVSGNGIFVLDGVKRNVTRDDVLIIPKGHLHAIKAITELTFIEVQTGAPLIEEDIERFEYEW